MTDEKAALAQTEAYLASIDERLRGIEHIVIFWCVLTVIGLVAGIAHYLVR